MLIKELLTEHSYYARSYLTHYIISLISGVEPSQI